MENFLQYVVTDPDARILFLVMVGLALFALSVFGWAAVRIIRPIRLKRRQAREHEDFLRRREQHIQYMQHLRQTGQLTSIAVARRGRSFADLAEQAFNHKDSDTGPLAAIQD